MTISESRPRIRAAGVTLAMVAFILIVMEVTCRIEDWVTYRTPLLSRASSVGDLVVRDADGMHGRPNATFLKWRMNALGMRGPEVTLVAPRHTIRVITVGASETFGQRESVDREYPRQLGDSLSARARRGACGSDDRRFEVLNAAFAGMSLPTIEQDVRTRLRRLRPDIVVLYPSPSQYLQDDPPIAAPRSASANSAALSASSALHFRVWNRLRDQLKLLLPQRIQTWLRAGDVIAEVRLHPASWRFQTVPGYRLKQFEADLRTIIGSIRAIGAEPVLATHGNIFMGRSVHDADILTTWEKNAPRRPPSRLLSRRRRAE